MGVPLNLYSKKDFMKNLIPSYIQKNKNVLYIIGNGFDLAHGMKTSYEDFHQWLLCNGASYAVYRLERLYPNLRNDLGRWCDLEAALGSVTLKEAIGYDKDFQDCPNEVNFEDSSHDAYRCGENLKNVVDILPGLLRDWVASITTNDVRPIFELNKGAKFLSFNYTRTLENVYQIKTDKILHIHETVIGDRPLVVGYGESRFEDDEYVPDDDAIDVVLIKNLLSHCRKPVDAILKEPIPKKWFESLGEIESVIVYGHSCSMVDKPYFETVADNIKANASWTFNVHDTNKNKSIEKFALSILTDKMSFKITNQ